MTAVTAIVDKTSRTAGTISAGVFPDISGAVAQITCLYEVGNGNQVHIVDASCPFTVTGLNSSNVDTVIFYKSNVVQALPFTVVVGETVSVVAKRTIIANESTITLSVSGISDDFTIKAPRDNQMIPDPSFIFGGQISILPGAKKDRQNNADAYSLQKIDTTPGSNQYMAAAYSRQNTTTLEGSLSLWALASRETYMGLQASTTTPTDHLGNITTYRNNVDFLIYWLFGNRFQVYENGVFQFQGTAAILSTFHGMRIVISGGVVTNEFADANAIGEVWTSFYTSGITASGSYRFTINPATAAYQGNYGSPKFSNWAE